MTSMRASCVVTIQPTITQAGMKRLATAVLDKLWPGNAGGIHLLQGPPMLKLMQRLAAYAAEHGMVCRLRVVREGVSYRLEPMGDPVPAKGA